MSEVWRDLAYDVLTCIDKCWNFELLCLKVWVFIFVGLKFEVWSFGVREKLSYDLLFSFNECWMFELCVLNCWWLHTCKFAT